MATEQQLDEINEAFDELSALIQDLKVAKEDELRKTRIDEILLELSTEINYIAADEEEEDE